jgi:DNA repair exonuclease SbcCD ATPase subunit
VPTKQTPSLNNWLKIGSVAFGVSCGCTLPFTQNLAQSALIGLAAMPGVGASIVLRSRQRQRQIDGQLGRGRLRLNELQQRKILLNEQLQVRQKDCQAIESRVSQLHSLAANLTDRINTDRDRQQQLEQQLVALVIYSQEQEIFSTKLDRKIQDKQAHLLEIDTNSDHLKLGSRRLQATQDRLIAVAALEEQAKISIGAIQAEIEQCSIIKGELDRQIRDLQNQHQLEAANFDELVERQHLLLHELDGAINDRQKNQQSLMIEVARLELVISEKSPELTIQSQKLTEIRSQLSATEIELRAKQIQLDDLVTATIAKENEIQVRQRELKMAQLELSSRKAELDNLELKIQSKSEAIDRIDPQIFEPQPPTISRSIDEFRSEGEWYDKFIDNPHLTVLQHIDKHGTITETEASSKLGNARSVRQFANKIEEYIQDLPFSIRVESSPKGNRYLKEDRN